MDRQITVDDAAAGLADELASLTGETVEAAVARAVRERLEREKEVYRKVADIMALAKEIREHVEPGTTSDHSWLYDEDGFPA
jgi:hypothetical protein